ncbi:MAG: hypothetical protein ACLP5V_13345 [Candidatus Bathyarchaeia archaeon]
MPFLSMKNDIKPHQARIRSFDDFKKKFATNVPSNRITYSSANLHFIVVKIAFDTRCVAEVNGEPVEAFRIGPGFMVAYGW